MISFRQWVAAEKKKKNGRRFLCGAVALSVFFALTGCSVEKLLPTEDKNPDGISSEGEISQASFIGMKIAYCTGEDLDPFTSSQNINRSLLSLCYDSLITLDSSYAVSSSIADFTEEGEKVTFTLREDALFSDGTPITAADCVYSFRQAERADSVWKSRLEKVASYSAESERVFTVTFSGKSRFSVNLLTIPVVKSGGKSGGFYIGSGRYFLSYEDGELCLRGRTDGRYGEEYEFTRIGLVGTEDSDDLTYLLNYGKVIASPVDLSSDSVRYKGRVELITYPTLKMVFLSVNYGREYLSDPAVSRAMSMAINRTEAVRELYRGMAIPTWQPFSPAWYKTVEAGIGSDFYSSSSAGELLTEAGLTFSGLYRGWKGETLTLTLLCNGNVISREIAAYVAEALENVGFDIRVVSRTGQDYLDAVETGDFDLYIGEAVLPPDMDFSCFLDESICRTFRIYSADETGITDLDRLTASLTSFLEGDGDMRSVVSAFGDCQPFIPLWYTEGALAVNRTVNGDFNPSSYEVFDGIESWYADN